MTDYICGDMKRACETLSVLPSSGERVTNFNTTSLPLWSMPACPLKCVVAQESEALMKSKTINWAVIVVPFLFMNGFVASFIRPVSILAIIVMNAAYVAVLLAVLPSLRKYVERRRF